MGFPAGPAAVGQARERTGRALAAWRIPLVVDDTAAVVSELMTNAVIHTVGRRVELVLTCGDGLLLVEVRDESTLPPTPVRNAGDDAEGGRGLQLVDALASDWGWLPLNQKRKAVWALLAVHRAVSVATA
jgi:anti-sigma regulatory factor (Ser/Thr protein kinase)